MALIKCLACGEKLSVGWMPTTTCGVLLIIPVGVAGGITIAATEVMWSHWGWVSLVLAVPLFLLLVVAGVLALHYIPCTIEYLLFCWRKCPRCGKRRWSFPFVEGFGP